jgi:hypothetical protein
MISRVCPPSRTLCRLLCKICTAATILVNFFVCQVLDANEAIVRMRRSNYLVKLGLQGGAISVLSILDDEDHQKRNNGRAGVDDELQAVGVAEERAE